MTDSSPDMAEKRRRIQALASLRVRVRGLDGDQLLDAELEPSSTVADVKRALGGAVGMEDQSLDATRLDGLVRPGHEVVELTVVRRQLASAHDMSGRGPERTGDGDEHEPFLLADPDNAVRPGDLLHFADLIGGSGDYEGFFLVMPDDVGIDHHRLVVYGHAEMLDVPGSLKVVVGDTRYFDAALSNFDWIECEEGEGYSVYFVSEYGSCLEGPPDAAKLAMLPVLAYEDHIKTVYQGPTRTLVVPA